MPKKWTAEHDQKLLLLLIKILPNITGAQMADVATEFGKLIGEKVSPKAITERLAKIKKMNPVGDSSTPSTPRKTLVGAGAKKASAKKTPAKAKPVYDPGFESPTDDEENIIVKKQSVTPKRELPARGIKRNYAAMDDSASGNATSSSYDADKGKKVKVELISDDDGDDHFSGSSQGFQGRYETEELEEETVI